MDAVPSLPISPNRRRPRPGWPTPAPPSTPRWTAATSRGAGRLGSPAAPLRHLVRAGASPLRPGHDRRGRQGGRATTPTRWSPEAAELEVALKRRLLADAIRRAAALAGEHALRLWETDVTTFDPAIKPDLEEEARLSARYTELLASREAGVRRQTVNLAGLGPYAEDPDRETRYEAEKVRWGFFEPNAAELDDIYDQLVKLRHGMARKLGYETFTPLGYRRLRRVDYGPDDVARYRAQVLEHVVPLVGRLLEARRAENGWDRLRFWDEALIDPAGNPKPIGDHDVLVEAAAGDVRRHGAQAGHRSIGHDAAAVSWT